jgi:hypothetical protein
MSRIFKKRQGLSPGHYRTKFQLEQGLPQ